MINVPEVIELGSGRFRRDYTCTVAALTPGLFGHCSCSSLALGLLSHILYKGGRVRTDDGPAPVKDA